MACPASCRDVFGKMLGILDLDLAAGSKGWHVRRHDVTLRPVSPAVTCDGDGESPARVAILAATQEAHGRTLAYVRAEVGETTRAIDSHFALLGENAAMQLVAEAQSEAGQRLLAQNRRARSAPAFGCGALQRQVGAAGRITSPGSSPGR